MQKSRERDSSGALDALRTRDDEQGTSSSSSSSGRGRLSRLFSARWFLVAVVLSAVGLFVGGSIPVVGLVGRYVGLFVAAFAVGLLSTRRRYVETALAAAIVSALGFVVGVLSGALFPVGVQVLQDYGLGIAGVGAGTGLVVALAGHYFGRDLRDGLTREV